MVGKSFGDYSRSIQAGVLVSLALLLGAVGFWFWVLPVSRECSSQRDKVSQLRAQNQANRSLEKQRALLQMRLTEAEDRLQAIKTMVPDQPDVDGLVTLLRDAESATGVHVRLFTSQPQIQADEYVEVPYKVHVDGTYFALLNFFDHLASATRVINVGSLSLAAPTPAGHGSYKIDSSETVATDFTLSAYYNHARPSAPAAKKP